MPWVILDDAFPDDPRVLRAGLEALGAVAACVAYCNRALSDGFLPTPAVARLGIGKPLLRRLLAEDLLTVVRDGYRLADDVAGWQPTRERVERERKAKAERQARWRKRVDASRDASTDTQVTPPVTPARPTPPRPAPKGQGAGTPSPPRCEHGRRIAADGAGCALCDAMPPPALRSVQ
jgi:hypothetical protein